VQEEAWGTNAINLVQVSFSLHLVFTQGNIQCLHKNAQQFKTHGTMKWLVGKVKGGTTGCGNVRSLDPSKQCALCKMAYSGEKYVFNVKTFYQTSTLWLYKDSFGGNSACNRHQQELHSAVWYRRLN
jgi:hypothetical protein